LGIERPHGPPVGLRAASVLPPSGCAKHDGSGADPQENTQQIGSSADVAFALDCDYGLMVEAAVVHLAQHHSRPAEAA
jgi:hypothetical protein